MAGIGGSVDVGHGHAWTWGVIVCVYVRILDRGGDMWVREDRVREDESWTEHGTQASILYTLYTRAPCGLRTAIVIQGDVLGIYVRAPEGSMPFTGQEPNLDWAEAAPATASRSRRKRGARERGRRQSAHSRPVS